MHIQGPAHLHGAQAINPPHRLATPPSAAARTGSLAEVDQLDISYEASLVSRVQDAPDIRTDRVAQIRAQIQAGVYETDEKLNGALDRLLDEIG